ncbi:hypothetical protein HUG15_08020 [Salicibibacter cibarius]|uniref:Uncharacterized protein n=1 Tax=Salicibibacter cibarius TaxID=2743000 RepID=A0A7T6Z2A7_9BACI|nr:hypothetical protein [Salicibibacter cibarius]QQK75532.1 hypothetical protein HUG15_08020 [Salicibibacter cibarius]
MKEIITLIQSRKLECTIAFIIILMAIGAGIFANEMLEVGRNWVVRFYLAFTFVSLLLFSIYIGLDRIFSSKKQSEET